jgi:DNA-binding NarL/FixJ family response regulator
MTEVKKVFSRSSGGEQQGEKSPTSDREKEIVQLVVQGYGDQEISERLSLEDQTVNDYMHGIFDRYGVSDRLELTLYAIQHHLIGQP